MSLTPDMLDALPGLIACDGEPVFSEPWEAEAFAMTIALHEREQFTWAEWAQALGHQISTMPDDTPYYQAWLSALEEIMIAKRLVSSEGLSERKDAWDRAARATPHGEPIELGAEIRAGGT